MLRFDPQYEHVVHSEQEAQEAEDHGRALVCVVCGHVITRQEEKITVHGKHAHVFFNPAGIVFELGCFRSAPGCASLGRPTLEFTWFDGFAWRVCICSQCGNHLGWHYQNVHDPQGFFGLILSQLCLRQI